MRSVLTRAPLLLRVARSSRTRDFSTSRPVFANRILQPIRNVEEWEVAQLASSSANRPLLLLWTASWCRTCRTVAPLMRSLIESGVGEAGSSSSSAGKSSSESQGVTYAEVELDAPDMTEFAGMYVVTSVPTLMCFVNNSEVLDATVRDGRKIAKEEFLRAWIEEQSARDGGGPGLLSRLFSAEQFTSSP